MFHGTRITLEQHVSRFDSEAASQRLGITFQTPHILQQALTHKSFRQGITPTNERLHEVGRRALEFYATDAGMEKLGKAVQEDALINFVREKLDMKVLAQRFDSLGLSEGLQYHLPGPPTTTVKGKAMQALIGAVYHDRGNKAAQAFANQHVFDQAI